MQNSGMDCLLALLIGIPGDEVLLARVTTTPLIVGLTPVLLSLLADHAHVQFGSWMQPSMIRRPFSLLSIPSAESSTIARQ